MYKPLVTIEYENYPRAELMNRADEMIIKAISQVDIYVDKEELIKAMNYDRGQYEKGYQDCMDEQVKVLEKALDIAIKDLCFSATGADACNSLEVLYVGIRDRIMEQARKEVQE